ncbi:MAG: ribonuclease III [Nitrospinae bacterium]|nr:ribonuclease III [Nitrospinota bacterium]
MTLGEIETQVGYSFSNKELLVRALTHRSFSQESSTPTSDNERLEFLGDAVLQLIVTEKLWKDFPADDEGVLTHMRSERVNGRTLAGVFKRRGLGNFIRLGKGEEKTGGRQKPSIQAGAVEALVGAIYLDAGYARCTQWAQSWFWAAGLNEEDVLSQDFKSQLQRLAQKNGNKPPGYRLVRESGPEHEKKFEVEVRLGRKVMGRGQGTTKKAAEQVAAKEAVYKIGGSLATTSS